MAAIKKDEYGRLFEEGMLVLNYYPYSLDMREEGMKNNNPPKKQKVIKIKNFPNQAKFVCIVNNNTPGEPNYYDPSYLEPIEYVTKNIEIIYGKK